MQHATNALVTVSELADRLRVSLATAYELVSSGKIVSCRVGPRKGAIRIREVDVENYLSNCQYVATEMPQSAPRATLKHIRLKS
jgi:excisionase family DNA binding protein